MSKIKNLILVSVTFPFTGCNNDKNTIKENITQNKDIDDVTKESPKYDGAASPSEHKLNKSHDSTQEDILKNFTDKELAELCLITAEENKQLVNKVLYDELSKADYKDSLTFLKKILETAKKSSKYDELKKNIICDNSTDTIDKLKKFSKIFKSISELNLQNKLSENEILYNEILRNIPILNILEKESENDKKHTENTDKTMAVILNNAEDFLKKINESINQTAYTNAKTTTDKENILKLKIQEFLVEKRKKIITNPPAPVEPNGKNPEDPEKKIEDPKVIEKPKTEVNFVPNFPEDKKALFQNTDQAVIDLVSKIAGNPQKMVISSLQNEIAQEIAKIKKDTEEFSIVIKLLSIKDYNLDLLTIDDFKKVIIEKTITIEELKEQQDDLKKKLSNLGNGPIESPKINFDQETIQEINARIDSIVSNITLDKFSQDTAKDKMKIVLEYAKTVSEICQELKGKDTTEIEKIDEFKALVKEMQGFCKTNITFIAKSVSPEILEKLKDFAADFFIHYYEKETTLLDKYSFEILEESNGTFSIMHDGKFLTNYVIVDETQKKLEDNLRDLIKKTENEVKISTIPIEDISNDAKITSEYFIELERLFDESLIEKKKEKFFIKKTNLNLPAEKYSEYKNWTEEDKNKFLYEYSNIASKGMYLNFDNSEKAAESKFPFDIYMNKEGENIQFLTNYPLFAEPSTGEYHFITTINDDKYKDLPILNVEKYTNLFLGYENLDSLYKSIAKGLESEEVENEKKKIINAMLVDFFNLKVENEEEAPDLYTLFSKGFIDNDVMDLYKSLFEFYRKTELVKNSLLAGNGEENDKKKNISNVFMEKIISNTKQENLDEKEKEILVKLSASNDNVIKEIKQDIICNISKIKDNPKPENLKNIYDQLLVAPDGDCLYESVIRAVNDDSKLGIQEFNDITEKKKKLRENFFKVLQERDLIKDILSLFESDKIADFLNILGSYSTPGAYNVEGDNLGVGDLILPMFAKYLATLDISLEVRVYNIDDTINVINYHEDIKKKITIFLSQKYKHYSSSEDDLKEYIKIEKNRIEGEKFFKNEEYSESYSTMTDDRKNYLQNKIGDKLELLHDMKIKDSDIKVLLHITNAQIDELEKIDYLRFLAVSDALNKIWYPKVMTPTVLRAIADEDFFTANGKADADDKIEALKSLENAAEEIQKKILFENIKNEEGADVKKLKNDWYIQDINLTITELEKLEEDSIFAEEPDDSDNNKDEKDAIFTNNNITDESQKTELRKLSLDKLKIITGEYPCKNSEDEDITTDNLLKIDEFKNNIEEYVKIFILKGCTVERMALINSEFNINQNNISSNIFLILSMFPIEKLKEKLASSTGSVAFLKSLNKGSLAEAKNHLKKFYEKLKQNEYNIVEDMFESHLKEINLYKDKIKLLSQKIEEEKDVELKTLFKDNIKNLKDVEHLEAIIELLQKNESIKDAFIANPDLLEIETSRIKAFSDFATTSKLNNALKIIEKLTVSEINQIEGEILKQYRNFDEIKLEGLLKIKIGETNVLVKINTSELLDNIVKLDLDDSFETIVSSMFDK